MTKRFLNTTAAILGAFCASLKYCSTKISCLLNNITEVVDDVVTAAAYLPFTGNATQFSNNKACSYRHITVGLFCIAPIYKVGMNTSRSKIFKDIKGFDDCQILINRHSKAIDYQDNTNHIF